MKTILLSGGAGFIGSHLCDVLIKSNKVICVDSLITGNKDNIKHLLNNLNFTFIEHNIIQSLEISQKIDQIFNLACPASPIDYQKFPIETLLVNAYGTKNMLDLAKDNKAKFLHTSTSEIYGDPKEHPQKETYVGSVNPIGPRSCYDEGKRFAESLIINYKEKYRLDAKIARIFNTYGPRMRKNDGRVVSNFITQALNNKPITVYGDGQQTRSFCYISDMIGGLTAMMDSSEEGPINLGNPNEFTILELAQKIISLTNSSSEIVYKDLPKDDPTRRRPDITLAGEKLGFWPKINLEEGLKKTIDWFNK